MKEYLELSHELARKQMQEKITLEIIYEFLILNAEEMEVTRIDDVNIFKEEEYVQLVDSAIKNINSKTKLNLKRNVTGLPNSLICAIISLIPTAHCCCKISSAPFFNS